MGVKTPTEQDSKHKANILDKLDLSSKTSTQTWTIQFNTDYNKAAKVTEFHISVHIKPMLHTVVI